jgi:hypothetical protein
MVRRQFLLAGTGAVAWSAMAQDRPGAILIRVEGIQDGERIPIPRVAVILLRRRPSLNVPWPLPAYSEITGADGWTRFSSVDPGVYTAVARSEPGPLGDESWRPAYLDGAPDWRSAPLIRATPGSAPQEFVIRLERGRPQWLSGQVLDEAGRPVRDARVTVFRAELPILPLGEVRSAAGGSFRFTPLWPGAYLVRAERSMPGGPAIAEEEIVLSANAPVSLRLRLEEPFPVEGTVHLEQPSTSMRPIETLRIHLLPARGAFNERVAQLREDHTFRFDAVPPGRYRILPANPPDGFYLDRIQLAGIDVLGEEVELRRGYGPLHVSFQPNPGRLNGRLEESSAEATVAAVSADPKLRDPILFLRSSPVGKEGEFELPNLRPGKYLVWAFDHFDPRDFSDDLLIEQLRPLAEVIEIRSGETSTAALKLISWDAVAGYSA